MTDYYRLYQKYKTKYLMLKQEVKQGGSKQDDNIEGEELYKLVKDNYAKHLTVGFLKKLKKGDIIDVAIFDRNFEEYKIWKLKEKHAYDPKFLFSANRAKIKYLGDLTWEIDLGGNVNIHPVEINTKKYTKKWNWIPLTGNMLIIDGTCGSCKSLKQLKQLKKSKKALPFEKIDDDIRIGWRGPMMLWKDIKKLPKVYYVNPSN